MVKHIVLYTLREGVDKQSAVEQIAGLLEPLVGQIPGLLWMEVNASQGGADYALYSEFESMQALADYQENPLHLAAKAQFHEWISSRMCADYEF